MYSNPYNENEDIDYSIDHYIEMSQRQRNPEDYRLVQGPPGRPPQGPPGRPPQGPPGRPPQGPPGGPPPGPPPRNVPPGPAQGYQPVSFEFHRRSIERCLFRFTYIWLFNGRNFWFFPIFIAGNNLIGFRWRGNRWENDTLNIRNIFYFECR